MKLLKIIVLLFISLNLIAQEKKTNWSIGGSIFGTGNIYSSSFKQISDIPNCCSEFKGAFGLGFGILGYAEYQFKENKFPFNWKAGVGLSYSDLSAKFSETSEIGNVIIGNTYTKGKSEYKIDISLSGLGIEPYTTFELFQNIPLEIKVGFQLYIPTTKKFEQEEKLISPSNGTFENLKTIRNSASGDIKNFNGAIIFPSLGFKYELYKTGSFIFSGLANYYFGIHNVVSNINWKIDYINAGLAVNYRIPQAKKLPPPPPPEPELPLPPKESVFTYNLKAFVNGIEVENYGNIEYNINRDKYTFKSPIVPIMYYKYNTSDFAEYQGKNEQIINQNSIKRLLLTEFDKNKNVKLKIINSFLTSENKDIVESRVNNFIRIFQKAFISEFNINQLIIENNPISDDMFNRPELAEEAINLRFEIVDGDKIKNILTYEKSEYRNIKAEKTEIKFVPEIVADAQPARFMGVLDLNNKTVMNLDKDNLAWNYSVDNLDVYKEDLPFYGVKTLRALTDVVDAESKTKSFDFQLNIEDKIINKNTYEFNTFNDTANTYILGFFGFDESEFSYVNELAILEYEKAKNKGQKIEIIASTDNIGEKKHNILLAKKRYNAALKLLKSNGKNINFSYPDDYLFDNAYPQGRAYNRSVIIKVFPE